MKKREQSEFSQTAL